MTRLTTRPFQLMYIQSSTALCNYVFIEFNGSQECKNDSIAGFILLHLCLRPKNLAFYKKQFSTFVFAFDLKCPRLNNLLKSFKIILHLK